MNDATSIFYYNRFEKKIRNLFCRLNQIEITHVSWKHIWIDVAAKRYIKNTLNEVNVFIVIVLFQVILLKNRYYNYLKTNRKIIYIISVRTPWMLNRFLSNYLMGSFGGFYTHTQHAVCQLSNVLCKFYKSNV